MHVAGSLASENMFGIRLTTICRCDGIGRRSGLKIHRQRWRAGSSPATGPCEASEKSEAFLCVFGENGGKGLGVHGRREGCGLREFRASADARVPFPQGKGTKGCRGPARIPCGAPAPGPPSDKYLVSVEPRRGAPDGVPFGSALTAPLKTFRFQRGPVLRGGKSQRGGDRASHIPRFKL